MSLRFDCVFVCLCVCVFVCTCVYVCTCVHSGKYGRALRLKHA